MIKRVYILSIISLLILSTFVYAAGSSTVNSAQGSSNNNGSSAYNAAGSIQRDINPQECAQIGGETKTSCDVSVCRTYCDFSGVVNPEIKCRDLGGVWASANNGSCTIKGSVTTCENKATLNERIKCRMENPSVARSEAYNNVEEACRGHANVTKSACENLYKNSAKCYDMSDSVEKKRCFLVASGVSFNSGGTFRAAPQDSKRNYVVLLLYELQERIEEAQEEEKITVDQATSLITKIVEIKKMIIAKEARSNIIVKINEFKQEYRTVLAGVEQ